MLPDEGRRGDSDAIDEVARLSIDVVVKELVDILGLKRTAAIGSVKDTRRVQEWLARERQPQRPEALRTALQAARIILESEDRLVTQAWFTGCNQHFAFTSPIEVLQGDTAEQFTQVVRAAFEFARR